MASRYFLFRSKTLSPTFNRALNPSSFLIHEWLNSSCRPGHSLASSPLPPPPDSRSDGSSFPSPFDPSKVIPCRPYHVLYGGYTKSAALCSLAEAQSRGMQHQAYNTPPEHSQSTATEKNADIQSEASNRLPERRVVAFSPLETAAVGKRISALAKESLKIKRSELSQKITLALIPALLLTSTNGWTTSLLIFSVYWQIYGFFKEILLDYVHHEVTRKWVLIYLQLLLLVLAKDTILCFNLV